MKNLVKFISVLSVVLFALSCGNNVTKTPEQEKSEALLMEDLKAPSSYKFISYELTEEETLEEQIKDRLDYFEGRYAKDEKDITMISHLQQLLQGSAEGLQKVVAKEYTLTYEAQNPMGVMLRSKFTTRFNDKGEIVATQHNDGDWNLIGEFFSIPGFYELL